MKLYKLIVLIFLLTSVCVLSQTADKEVVIDNILINGTELSDKANEFTIAKTDSLKINFSLKSINGPKNAFIFRITIKNSKDSSTFTVNNTTVGYYNLPEDSYEFIISAFNPRNLWTADPKRIKFRVNNKDAQLKKEYDSLKIVSLANNAKALNPENLLNDIQKNKLLFYGIIVFFISIFFLILYVLKLKKKKGNSTEVINMANGNDNDKNLSEIANLKAEIAALRAQIDAMQSRGDDLRKQNEELRESMEKLTLSKKEVEDLQVQKDDLFAVIIHDIKNPASLIKQLVDLLRSYDLNAMEQQEVINDIFDTTSKIVKLSQEVTRVLALEGTSLRMTWDKVDVNEILKDVCKRNSIAAKKKNIDLLIDVKENIPATFIDINKIDEVCDNLISNSIKFNLIGGQVKVSSSYSDGFITIQISDTGQGLSEEDVRKAFNRGVKLSALPTGGENSSGFGLWIVKKLIESHNGRVWVKSAVGKGSTFAFSLPVTNDQPIETK